jgi:hypothetical protein
MEIFIPLVMGVVFLMVGLLIAFGDPKRIIQFDRRTGYAIYRGVLDRGGSEDEALAAAKTFYRIFGLVFALVGLGMTVATSAMMVSRLGPP